MAFSKLLTEDDVEKNLLVPMDWMTILPSFKEGSNEVQVGVLDGLGLYWEFCFSIQTDGFRLCPIFKGCDGWLQFVNYRGLRVGDKITLYLKDNIFRETKYVIRAQRLYGDGYWIDIGI